MSSIPRQTIEGTGAEISEYAKNHPKDRFRLTVLSPQAKRGAPSQSTWDKAMRTLDEFRGKMPPVPAEALTTDALYDL